MLVRNRERWIDDKRERECEREKMRERDGLKRKDIFLSLEYNKLISI